MSHPELFHQLLNNLIIDVIMNELHLQFIVLIVMNSKILDLLHWDVTLELLLFFNIDITCRHCSESSDLDFFLIIDMLPLVTVLMGSMTRASHGSLMFWYVLWVETSIPESQQP